MRLPSVLYLIPSIAPRPQSPPTPAGNVESFAGLLSSPPVALRLSQLASDRVLTRFPARAVSSDSPFNTSALPGSAVSSALDLPNSNTPGTFHLRDATPDPPSGVCQGLIEDLDITGLGVRITFYVTSVLTVINACVPGSDARGSSWATLFAFVALMVSAIAQAANHSISLYNTIIVLYLCYLQLICELMLVVGSMQKRSMGAQVSEVGLPAKVVLSLPHWSWHGFGLYVWVHARRFGSQPECNAATKLIVFGRELSATGSGRVVSLVFFGISATVILSVPVITLAGVGFLLVFLIKAFHPLIGSYRLSAGPRTSFIKILFVNIYITFCFLVQWIYVVVTIEQTIQRNPVIHNGPWFPITFGQIFPVVTIGACLVSIYNDLRESRREPPISQGNDPNGPIKADV